MASEHMKSSKNDHSDEMTTNEHLETVKESIQEDESYEETYDSYENDHIAADGDDDAEEKEEDDDDEEGSEEDSSECCHSVDSDEGSSTEVDYSTAHETDSADEEPVVKNNDPSTNEQPSAITTEPASTDNHRSQIENTSKPDEETTSYDGSAINSTRIVTAEELLDLFTTELYPPNVPRLRPPQLTASQESNQTALVSDESSRGSYVKTPQPPSSLSLL
ncbi:unnamed protein product [Echinostoma caproni]|uniref:Uncharacterized protein n=1 Tax=Echinostoma caproni TaxID=27848 RepID=A0A183BDR9_9TREM|nr:unnamed protein product [Echinostoma caproni]